MQLLPHLRSIRQTAGQTGARLPLPYNRQLRDQPKRYDQQRPLGNPRPSLAEMC